MFLLYKCWLLLCFSYCSNNVFGLTYIYVRTDGRSAIKLKITLINIGVDNKKKKINEYMYHNFYCTRKSRCLLVHVICFMQIQFPSKASLPDLVYIFCRTLVMRRTFRHLDADGSGFLTQDEIINAATSECGLDVKADMISDMLIALVKDNDKKVLDYVENSRKTYIVNGVRSLYDIVCVYAWAFTCFQ